MALCEALAFCAIFDEDPTIDYTNQLCEATEQTPTQILGTFIIAYKNEMYGLVINVLLPNDEYLVTA